VDDFRRVSYCYIKLGSYKVPVYQPGTIMFFSGVKESCPFEIFHNGCGQNGPILGRDNLDKLTYRDGLCTLSSQVYEPSKLDI